MMGGTSNLEEMLIASGILNVGTLMSLDVICYFLCIVSNRMRLPEFQKSTHICKVGNYIHPKIFKS
jgi:hypothetical protein